MGIVPWRGSTMAIHIWIRRWVVSTIRIFKTAGTARWWIVVDWAPSGWRSAVAATIIIIITTTSRASITITAIPTRTVTSTWAPTIIVIHGIRPTTWRSRSTPVTRRDIRLRICSATDCYTFELSAIELFYGSLKIYSSFELNESFAISVTACLRIDYVKAGLTGEIFEVLYPESM